MMGHRIVALLSILSLLLAAVDISDGSDPRELIVQFRGATCTAQTQGSCVGDWSFREEDVLPINLFHGSAPGAQAPVIGYPLGADPESFFAVVMLDRDAPSPISPTMAPWLHWMMVNILGDNLLLDEFEGDTKKVYAPPTPPSGVHRYKFILFRQPGYLNNVPHHANRARFDVIAFERDYQLVPVAWTSFKTGRD